MPRLLFLLVVLGGLPVWAADEARIGVGLEGALAARYPLDCPVCSSSLALVGRISLNARLAPDFTAGLRMALATGLSPDSPASWRGNTFARPELVLRWRRNVEETHWKATFVIAWPRDERTPFHYLGPTHLMPGDVLSDHLEPMSWLPRDGVPTTLRLRWLRGSQLRAGLEGTLGISWLSKDGETAVLPAVRFVLEKDLASGRMVRLSAGSGSGVQFGDGDANAPFGSRLVAVVAARLTGDEWQAGVVLTGSPEFVTFAFVVTPAFGGVPLDP